MHFPELLSQETVWQFLCSQTTGVKTHCPLEQESVVHALLSSQTFEVYTHPFMVSQDPIEHLFPLSQVIGMCWIPLHTVQVSLVHALWSSS
jgi:hypothetical protein